MKQRDGPYVSLLHEIKVKRKDRPRVSRPLLFRLLFAEEDDAGNEIGNRDHAVFMEVDPDL